MPESSAVQVAAASVSVAEQEIERPEKPDVVGVATMRQHSEIALVDPESSQSDATDSPPESDFEEEAESESSDRGGGEFGPPDSPRESTSCLLYTSPSPRD